jgi:hypothetical protein
MDGAWQAVTRCQSVPFSFCVSTIESVIALELCTSHSMKHSKKKHNTKILYDTLGDTERFRRRLPDRMRNKYVNTKIETTCSSIRYDSETKWMTDIEHDVSHHYTHISPTIVVENIEIRFQELIRRSDRAKFTTACRCWIGQVTTGKCNEILHVLSTCLARRRVQGNKFNGWTSDVLSSDRW